MEGLLSVCVCVQECTALVCITGHRLEFFFFFFLSLRPHPLYPIVMRSTPGHAKVVLPLEEEEEEERGGRSNFLSLPPHPKKNRNEKENCHQS
jgi:hypothetical protein